VARAKVTVRNRRLNISSRYTITDPCYDSKCSLSNYVSQRKLFPVSRCVFRGGYLKVVILPTTATDQNSFLPFNYSSHNARMAPPNRSKVSVWTNSIFIQFPRCCLASYCPPKLLPFLGDRWERGVRLQFQISNFAPWRFKIANSGVCATNQHRPAFAVDHDNTRCNQMPALKLSNNTALPRRPFKELPVRQEWKGNPMASEN
jgi:hypothetical protein